jgi:hypothetical protein
MHDYNVGVTVRRFEPKARDPHDLLLVKDEPGGKEQVEAGWREIWEGARPGDTREHLRGIVSIRLGRQSLRKIIVRRAHGDIPVIEDSGGRSTPGSLPVLDLHTADGRIVLP